MYYPQFAGYHLPRRTEVRATWRPRKLWSTALAAGALVLLCILTAVVVGFTLLLLRIRPTLPSAAAIAAFRPAEATTVWSSDGVLLAKLQIENRKVVPLEQ